MPNGEGPMPTTPQSQPRWLYRLDNYKRAFALLREAVETMETRELSALEREGVVQRFEYTWELAWHLLKDYLSHSGIVLTTVTPAATLRAAITAGLITDGEVWMRALDARNKMAHTYNARTFERIVAEIRSSFLPLLDRLHLDMLERSLQERDG
jgi:nucleotidyltransferase substrate binding protein (TIGR01987 family)